MTNPWYVLLLAILLAGSSFLLQGRTGINVGDEGFLWYGAQQTARGAVPVRDFQSYDPRPLLLERARNISLRRQSRGVALFPKHFSRSSVFGLVSRGKQNREQLGTARCHQA